MVIIIKVTYPDQKTAIESIRNLLTRDIISSANYFPIRSISKWAGKIEEVSEVLVLLKTKESNWEKVRDEVKKTHPYEVPCIMKLDSEANKDYKYWVEKQTSKSP